MGEPFDAIGFHVRDEASYHMLAEEAHQRGDISRAPREHGTLHGCCWQLGDGIEVWTMLYESKEGLFYADCRPAFRGRHTFALYPWEITEYEEDGEATVHALIEGSETELSFELQNLTEVNPLLFHERALTATVSGLAYRARIQARAVEPVFTPLGQVSARKHIAENDYAVRGAILYWREIKNPRTDSSLLWIHLQAGKVRLEVLVNRADLKGEIRQGDWLSAEVWLQGHILSEQELQARYEGVDEAFPLSSFWSTLRREN
jgi:hypothetical protein